MGRVVLDMAVSLDGFVCDPEGGDGGLHDWYFSPTPVNAAAIAEAIQSAGALVMGRRSFELGMAHDGYVDNPYRVLHVVLTHEAPAELPDVDTRFVFVTHGLGAALAAAQAAAGDREVVIAGGASTARQFLQAGLVDELYLHLVPVLLGGGLRLFEGVGGSVNWASVGAVGTPTVTHLRYRAVRA